VSHYINLLVGIAHITCDHPLYSGWGFDSRHREW